MQNPVSEEPDAGETPRRAVGRQTLAGLAMVVVTLAAYYPAMRGGFIWDDNLHLTRNELVRDASPARIWLAPFSSIEYYPVTWTSYWLEHRIWGMHPRGYHMVNVLLHAACALLAWRVLLRLRVPAAWLVALVFSLHPVNVETVAWITQRKNLLSMLFSLAALLTHLRYEDEHRARRYLTAVLFFAAAMLSKAAVIPLPAILLASAWWRRGAIRRDDVLRCLPYVAVAVLATVVQQPVRNEMVTAGAQVHSGGFMARLAGAGWAVWFYLFKALLPIDLIFVYPRWVIDPRSAVSYLPGAALLALFAALFWQSRRIWCRAILFAMVCYVVMLSPALGFVDFYFLKYSFVADHYQYFAIVAIIALVIGAILQILRRVGKNGTRPAYVGAALILLILTAQTWRQQLIYHDNESLWRDTIARNPTAWMAHNNLGNELLTQGRVTEAVEKYRAVLRIRPEHAVAHNNLGIVMAQLERPNDAIACFQEALRINANLPGPRNNLGDVFEQQGRYDEAIESYEDELRRHPRSSLAIRGIAWILATHPDPNRRQPNRAVVLARHSAVHNPFRHAAAHDPLAASYVTLILDTLATAYAAAGRFDDAVSTARVAWKNARLSNRQELVDRIASRLRLFEEGRAFVAQRSGES